MLLFQSHFTWENGSPLTFQLFTNVNFGKNTIITYRCSTSTELELINGNVNTKCVNIRDIKFIAASTLYPHVSKTCTSMLLSNLAEPEWIQIDCNHDILASVICVQNKRNHNTSNKFTQHRQQLITKCQSWSLSKNNECFMFHWFDTDLTAMALNLSSIIFLTFVFDAVTIKFPPILAPVSGVNCVLNKFSYTKILNTYNFTRTTIDCDDAEGYFVSSSERLLIESGSNTFFCTSGSHISPLYICDGNVDCPYDNSDEMLKLCKNITNISEKSLLVDYQET